jgi:hypothetical protein
LPERAHVMEIGQDFIDGHWSVSCFCGWSAETLWDDREDAVAEYQRHKEGDQSGVDLSGDSTTADSLPIGPDCPDQPGQ